MSKITTFLALSRPEKLFFGKAFSLQIYFVVLLKTRSFKDIIRIAATIKRQNSGVAPHRQLPRHRACILTQTAARLTPFATCLSQSLAGSSALASQNIDSTIHIGVLKKNTLPFTAHAWLVCEGQLITGFLPNLADFTPIPSPFEEIQP